MTRPEPGLEFLPRLVLVRPLGRGGMGEVWVARDEGRGEEVVAKLLPADAPEERVALLRREARLVRKLKHPSIVPVYGFERGPNGSAVLCRLMRGGDAGRLRGASLVAIVRCGREVADALGYLHGLGVVHRDVKPSNVLLDEEGRAHLADFGIAAVAAPEGDERLVLKGGGSRASMSPQQRAGEPAEPADDVYALGALLYELVAGHPPFRADATDAEIRTADPAPLEAMRSVPERLRALVLSMLAKEPGDRPRDVAAVGEELRAIESSLSSVGSPSPAAPRRPGVRLQPPPRVPDFAVLPSLATEAGSDVDGGVRRAAGSLPPAQVALLGSLVVAALFVVLVLPRWAKTPSPPPDEVEDASATATSADASVPGASAIPAEAAATPEPAEASPTPPEDARAPEARPSREGRDMRAGPGRERAAPAAGGENIPAVRRARADFEAAMSDAYASLEMGDFEAARQAFARAGALQPGAPAIADGLRRVEDSERVASLARHREAARRLEANEDWRGALGEYEAALKLDPTVAFALEGRRRASRRALLADRLDFHARNRQRLTTDAVAREAEAVLQEAHEVDSPGSRHRQQIAALERALARARTVVTVVLHSDGVTEVVVNKVGRLGAFTRKSLELRPGTYTIVGTRTGYRDVRQTLVVDPDAPPPALVVRCEEAI